jgi:ATP-dependent Clp protease ATP-binding subunit ClpB
MSPGILKVINEAGKSMKEKVSTSIHSIGLELMQGEQNDSFIAQDHLILALIQDGQIAAILKEAGISVEAIKRSASQVRGGKQVNSKGAEDGFEALSKVSTRVCPAEGCKLTTSRQYARDLTADAESGRLDPVIGRDSEIRRCLRILSRRTKVSTVVLSHRRRA